MVWMNMLPQTLRVKKGAGGGGDDDGGGTHDPVMEVIQ
jgi:hypothetical protein